MLEDLDQAHSRIEMWVEANRNSIEVVRPLENALMDGQDPIQGMVTGSLDKMKQAESALKESQWHAFCECVRTEYPARDLSILDLLRTRAKLRGWKQAPPNDEDGVAVVLEAEVARLAASRA